MSSSMFLILILPTIFIYSLVGPIEVAAFSEFADQFLTGQLKPTLKSEAVVPADTEGNSIDW